MNVDNLRILEGCPAVSLAGPAVLAAVEVDLFEAAEIAEGVGDDSHVCERRLAVPQRHGGVQGKPTEIDETDLLVSTVVLTVAGHVAVALDGAVAVDGSELAPSRDWSQHTGRSGKSHHC